ncbi:HAD-IIB family hydrolase [Paenibacillus sp. WLX2291]|uniref:HAD-IIB family hydrolase n=1 Tax=Paenibacillus sp. WLX2291 TaxID=3296934 RepID=UPI003983E0D4
MKFVFDLDGTICYRGQPLTPPMIACLESLRAAGHEVIFASARPIRDLLPMLPKCMHGYGLVGGNGGFVHREEISLSVTYLDPAITTSILKTMQQYEADYLIDSDWHYSYSGDPLHPIVQNIDPHKLANNIPLEQLGNIVKMVILNSTDTTKVQAALEQLPIVIYKHGSEEIIDISPQGIDKWTALQQLGVQSGMFIAFGNDANDIPMFRHAAYSVCVGDHAGLLALATDHVAAVEQQVISTIYEIANTDRLAHILSRV